MNSNKNIARFFRWNAGPSFFYIASAACILLGAAMITIPLYENNNLEYKRFYLVGVINFYELALLLVSVLVCYWKKGNDDAISLVCLLGIFIVGSTISLDTVSVEFAWETLTIGAICFFVALLKLYILSKKVLGNIHKYLFIAIFFILLPNYFMPGILGITLDEGFTSNKLLENVWLIGWCCCVAVGSFLVFAATCVPERGFDETKPFLNRSIMHWVFVFILFFGSLCHQFTLNFAVDIGIGLEKFAPISIVCLFLGIEFKRIFQKTVIHLDGLWMLVPLALLICCSIQVDYEQLSFLGYISYPSLNLFIAGVWLARCYFRKKNDVFLSCSFLYISASITTIYGHFDIMLALYGLTTLITAAAVYKKKVSWSFAAVIFASLSLTHNPTLHFWYTDLGFSLISVHCFYIGLFSLSVYSFFREKLDKVLAIVASCLFAFGAYDCFSIPIFSEFGVITSIALFGIVSYILTKEKYTVLPMLYPLLAKLGGYFQFAWYQAKEAIPNNKGWIVIIVSFLLLGMGLLFSLAKVKISEQSEE